jgi:hypothetical protein
MIEMMAFCIGIICVPMLLSYLLDEVIFCSNEEGDRATMN